MKKIKSQGFDKISKKSKNNESESDNNPYSICTTSIGKSEGTTERSKWDQDAKDRYDECLEEVESKENSSKDNGDE